MKIALDRWCGKPLTVIPLALGWLACIVGIAYQDAPANGFHFDDYPNIVLHGPVRLSELTFVGLFGAARDSYLPARPLPSVTFAVDWWRGGGAVGPFQQTNVAIHALAAAAVFWLIVTVLRRGHACAPVVTIGCALLAASIWAVHPIQVQGVTYVVQRMASMAAFFTLCSVCCYVRGRWSSATGTGWFVGALLAFLCGALSKEIAWVTPLLIVLAEYGVCRRGEPLYRYRFDYLLSVLLVAAGVFIVVDFATGIGPLAQRFLPDYARLRDFTLEQRLLTQPRVIFFYLSQFLWPRAERFSIEHDFETSTAMLDPPSTLVAVIGLVVWNVGGVAFLFRQRLRAWGFFMLWVSATLAIESSVVPLEMVFEHRMYLPSVGLAGLCALALAELYDARIYLAGAVTAVSLGFLLFAMASTMERIPDWKDEISLNRSAIDNAPTSERLWANLGYYRIEAGHYAQGLSDALRALELKADYPLALKTAGLAMMRLDRLAEAEAYFARAYALAGPREHNLLSFYGELLYKLRRFDEAFDMFRLHARLEPANPAAHWNVARGYERNNDCAAALRHWQMFLALSYDARQRNQVMTHLAQTFRGSRGKCAGTL